MGGSVATSFSILSKESMKQGKANFYLYGSHFQVLLAGGPHISLSICYSLLVIMQGCKNGGIS